MTSYVLELSTKRVKEYINKSLEKLLGPNYYVVQKQIYQRNREGPLVVKPAKPSVPNYEQRNKPHKSKSGFGQKFIEHYGFSFNGNPKLYRSEYAWFLRYGKCRWEE